MKSAHH